MKNVQTETANLLYGQVREVDTAAYDAPIKLDRFRVTLEELFLHLTSDERRAPVLCLGPRRENVLYLRHL